MAQQGLATNWTNLSCIAGTHRWKERTYSSKPSFDVYMYAIIHTHTETHTHTYTHKMKEGGRDGGRKTERKRESEGAPSEAIPASLTHLLRSSGQ